MIPHWIIDIAFPVGTAACAIIGLMIKSAIQASAAATVKEIGLVGGKIDIHIAEDRILHDGMERRLTNLERT